MTLISSFLDMKHPVPRIQVRYVEKLDENPTSMFISVHDKVIFKMQLYELSSLPLS